MNINSAIENSLIGFGEQLKSRHINIEKNLANNLPLIKADKIQLEQVFINLISNARDALEGCSDKRITFSTQAQNCEIQIQVADNGVGIALERLPEIFDAFVTTKEKTGMGIGLHIAQDIIQTYDGRITVSSKINKGTTFFIKFSIAKEEEIA